MYSANAVANTILEYANDSKTPVTALQLQRLMFLSQAVCLRAHGYVMMDDFFCLWNGVPVIPSVYHKLRDFGESPVNRFITTKNADPDFANRPGIPSTDLTSRAVILAQMARSLTSAAPASKPTQTPAQLVHLALFALAMEAPHKMPKEGEALSNALVLEIGQRL